MKRNQLIIIGVMVIIFGGIFGFIAANKKPEVKTGKEEQTTVYVPVIIANNQERSMQLVSYGQVLPNAEIDVAVEVQGKIIAGKRYLKPGVSFQKGDVLYRIDDQEARYNLESRKAQLSNLLVSSLPEIELDYPTEVKKWSSFLDAVVQQKRLPELPQIDNSKERAFLTSRGVLSEYFALKSLEARLNKYTYVAPFSGTVLQTFAEPGAIANPGARIARIAKTSGYEVKVPLAVEHVESYQKQGQVTFTTPEGTKIGSGTLARMSDVINQQTQSIDAYYNISPFKGKRLYGGMYLNASIEQQTTSSSITVPRMSVSDNSIALLNKGQIRFQPVRVVGSKPDSLFITGVKNGDSVIIDKVETDTSNRIFKGIMR